MIGKIRENILKCQNRKEFTIYLENNFINIQSYFNNLDTVHLNNIKFKIEDIFYDLVDKSFIFKSGNTKFINAFLILLAELFEQLKLTSAIIELISYLPKEISITQRLHATLLYSKVNNISKEYHEKFEKIIFLIDKSKENEQFKYKTINSVIYFYLNGIENFTRTNNERLAQSFQKLFLDNHLKYGILYEKKIIKIVSFLNIYNYNDNIQNIKNNLLLTENILPNITKNVVIEKSEYSKKLYQISNPTFKKIQQISKNYIMDIGNPDSLHYQLNQGVTIIEEQDLLYKYLFNYGKMHKAKLYSSFDEVIYQLNNQTINIIDWGCGQALATYLLIDYIKEKNLKIKLSNITLIEPSQLALSRGLLHIDVLKENPIKIRAINKDIDSLEHSDLIIDNSYITLHLFSNILDVEFFKLDRNFLEKISNSQNGLNYFICVSPNINDKRNARLDMFYRYFSDNFDTELISDRNSSIGHYARYEKIFRVLDF